VLQPDLINNVMDQKKTSGQHCRTAAKWRWAAMTAMLDRHPRLGHTLTCGPRSWKTKLDSPREMSRWIRPMDCNVVKRERRKPWVLLQAVGQLVEQVQPYGAPSQSAQKGVTDRL